MRRVGFVGSESKLGNFDHQRELIGEVDVELLPNEHDLLSKIVSHPNEKHLVIVSHARAFGMHRSGFAKREEILDMLAGYGVMVQIADGDPVLYDTPERKALFHAASLLPTGKPSKKQKGNPGRPKLYAAPETDDQIRHAVTWWGQPNKKVNKNTGEVSGLSDAEVAGMIQGMMRQGKPASRQTITAWLGGRRLCRQVLAEGKMDEHVEVVRARIEAW